MSEPGGPVPPPVDRLAEERLVEERLHPLTPLVRLWIGVVAVGWFVLQEFLPGGGGLAEFRDFDLREMPWGFLVLLAALLVAVGFGYWSWWTTRFVIDDRELRIENTGAFRESKRIAFGRIQSVDVNQPFAARIVGLAELVIDVGGGDSSTRLSFLTRRRATELRDHLMARAHGPRHEAPSSGGARAWDDLAPTDQILIRLTPGDLIVGALLSMEMLAMLTALIVAPVIVTAALGSAIGLASLGGALVPLAVAMIGFLGNRVVGQFNYTLARTASGLRITRGLTTLKSQTLPAHRVQAIQISQPFTWRWLGRSRVDVSILGWGDVEEGEATTATLFLPVGTDAQVRTALGAIWPGLSLDGLEFTGPPARARRLDPFAYSWLGHAHDDRVVVARQGFLTRRTLVVPHARLQSVRAHQGPIARRLRVADVGLHTTNPLQADRIIHMDADEARAFVFDEMARARASRMDELLTGPQTPPPPAWQIPPQYPWQTPPQHPWQPPPQTHWQPPPHDAQMPRHPVPDEG